MAQPLGVMGVCVTMETGLTDLKGQLIAPVAEQKSEPELKTSEKKVCESTKMKSANSPGMTRLTPQVYLDDTLSCYLIRIDGDVVTVHDEESSAIAIADSLAVDEILKLEQPNVKVLRRDIEGGKNVQIFTQTRGYLGNGAPVRVMTIDIVVVSKACLVKPRTRFEES